MAPKSISLPQTAFTVTVRLVRDWRRRVLSFSVVLIPGRAGTWIERPEQNAVDP